MNADINLSALVELDSVCRTGEQSFLRTLITTKKISSLMLILHVMFCARKSHLIILLR